MDSAGNGSGGGGDGDKRARVNPDGTPAKPE